MEQDPANTPPKGTFAQAIESDRPELTTRTVAEPVMADAEGILLALYSGDIQLGWLGKNSGGWATLVTERVLAATLELYPHEGKTYYHLKGTDQYLSIDVNAYAGFYGWNGATDWRLEGKNLVCGYNGQKLSFLSRKNACLYAWNAYTVLDARFTEAPKPLPPVDPPLTDKIEHVVVVMLENRSFDNVLGGLYPELTQQGLYQGVTGKETNPLDPKDPGKGTVPVFQGAEGYDTWIMPYPDPGELFDDMNVQIFGTENPKHGATATMNGFVWNYRHQKPASLKQGQGPVKRYPLKLSPIPKNIMQYYQSQSVPISSFLATQYAVCDNWFAAGPVQTLANRIFTHCGTPGRVPGTNDARINNPDFSNDWEKLPPFTPPVSNKTVFEQLDEHYPNSDAPNWKVYYHDAPASALCQYVYANWSWHSLNSGNVFQFQEEFGSETNFEYDIKNNQLAKYSFIEPRYTNFFGGTVNSSHPGGAGVDPSDPNGNSLPPPISVRDGERFLLEVYNILRKYPDTFNKTLLVVIYDEHGGLYDHIPPGKAVSPYDVPVDNFPYDRHGVRIPAILINPLIKPGTIYPPRDKLDEYVFDHTSLISTLRDQFGLRENLTPRSTAAPTLKGLIPHGAKPTKRPEPPDVPGASELCGDDVKGTPALNVGEEIETLQETFELGRSMPLTRALIPLFALEQRRKKKQSRDEE